VREGRPPARGPGAGLRAEEALGSVGTAEAAERNLTSRDGWKESVVQAPTATPAVTSRQLLRRLPLRGRIM
jgi:hypothetical protein